MTEKQAGLRFLTYAISFRYQKAIDKLLNKILS